MNFDNNNGDIYTDSSCEQCDNQSNENTLIENLNNKKKLIIGLLSAVGISIGGITGHNLGSAILEEKERLSELDKENLNLKNIIDTTDDIGNNEYQLNWKEIASIVSVNKNNYTAEISISDIESVANLFINKENNEVRDISEVVENLELKKKEKQRIYDYLDDLEHHGYMPERLNPNSKQMIFINSIKEGAIESYETSKILPSITIAQAILESNWGDSNLTKEANNLFGIKADYYWNGEYVTFETNEFHNTMIKDKFRKYSSLSESIKDHSDFLLKNNRYKEYGVFEAKTYKEQAKALENAGYSTAEDEFGNKTYASMLEQIIRQYNLQVIDSEVINKKD